MTKQTHTQHLETIEKHTRTNKNAQTNTPNQHQNQQQQEHTNTYTNNIHRPQTKIK